MVCGILFVGFYGECSCACKQTSASLVQIAHGHDRSECTGKTNPCSTSYTSLLHTVSRLHTQIIVSTTDSSYIKFSLVMLFVLVQAAAIYFLTGKLTESRGSFGSQASQLSIPISAMAKLGRHTLTFTRCFLLF